MIQNTSPQLEKIEQQKKRRRFNLFCGLAFLLVVSACGCASPAAKAARSRADAAELLAHARQPTDLLHINSLLLYPPQILPSLAEHSEKRSRWLRQLSEAAQQEINVKLVELELPSGATPPPQNSSEAQMLDAARRAGVDGVLVTEVRRYVERVGSDIGVSKAAEVDLVMRVLRTTDGKKVWEANYHFRDQALSDNLLRADLSRGAHWKSSEELLTEGLRSGARDFARRRTAMFVQQ